MIRLRVDAADLARVRFAVDPLWETVMSVRTLTAPEPSLHLHRPWRSAAAARLERAERSGDEPALDIGLLTTLVRPAGFIPDFLTPPAARRSVSFERAIEQVAATDHAEVSRQLRHLSGHRVASAGPGRTARTRLLHELAADPSAALIEITSALTSYWRVAVRPWWPRLHAVLRADLAARLDDLADGGVRTVLRTLHPSVTFDETTIRVRKYYDGDAECGGRGLLLIPCAFAWPDVVVRTSLPGTPTMSYSPRGLGVLWDGVPHVSGSALAAVIGRSRASLLAQLDLPMTASQLAGALGLSAPTLNVHLHALRDAGLLRSRRDGRQVLFARTALGEDLLSGPDDPNVQ